MFGVPDEIRDMTRSLEMFKTYISIYWKAIFGYRKGFEWFGYLSEYRRVTGIRRGEVLGLIGPYGKERGAA